MKTWTRKGYVVNEVEFDRDLHEFEVVKDNGEKIATITPADTDDMQLIIKDLDNGEDVDGWEDGMGNTISIDVENEIVGVEHLDSFEMVNYDDADEKRELVLCKVTYEDDSVKYEVHEELDGLAEGHPSYFETEEEAREYIKKEL